MAKEVENFSNNIGTATILVELIIFAVLSLYAMFSSGSRGDFKRMICHG